LSFSTRLKSFPPRSGFADLRYCKPQIPTKTTA